MQHRRKRKFKDKEGDAWISMWEQSIEPLESKTELIDAIVGYDEAKLRSQAYNEVLFGDEGSDWGENGSRLLGSLDAVQTRMAEIERHNDTLDEGDEDLIIQYGEDQELLDLQAEYASFDTETAERLDALMDRERAKFEGKKLAELRAALTKRIVDLEGDMAWYQEYRIRMLFHACRKMESRKEHYFNDMEDILELPSPVQSQLMMALDQIDRGGDAKNSDSLLESLV
jgi:hypothetical protein